MLDQKGLNFTDFKNQLIHIVQDFQKNLKIEFVEESKLNKPFKQLIDVIPIIWNGINQYINYREKLASKFEIDFKKSKFQLSHEESLFCIYNKKKVLF